MGAQLGGGGAGGAGVEEPLVGDVGEGAVGGGAADPVVVGFEVKVALVPVLGLVEVTQPGHEQVGVAEVGRLNGLQGGVADPFGQVVGGLEVAQAGRVALLAQEPSEVLLADREGAQAVAAEVVEPVGGQVAVGRGHAAVPGGTGGLQAGGGGPVPPGAGDPHPILHDDAVLLVAAGAGLVGDDIEVVGFDVGDQAGPFDITPGQLV